MLIEAEADAKSGWTIDDEAPLPITPYKYIDIDIDIRECSMVTIFFIDKLQLEITIRYMSDIQMKKKEAIGGRHYNKI